MQIQPKKILYSPNASPQIRALIVPVMVVVVMGGGSNKGGWSLSELHATGKSGDSRSVTKCVPLKKIKCEDRCV